MSEDVSKFLQEVRQLGDRRVEEDEARSRELEEKILQEKRERQARRAERARSISPQKSSPASTPPPPAHRPRTNTQDSIRLNLESSSVLDPPSSPQSLSSPQTEEMASRGAFSMSPTKENELPFEAENKRELPASPTRSGTTARGLSWQKRPNSQASERSRSRPLSVVAAENAARSSTTPSEPSSATEPTSRDQIASALSGKDPAWFRQTADRGANSAAYRRSQVEDKQTADMTTMRAQLPGMSRGPSSDSSRDETSAHPESQALHGKSTSPALSSAPRLDPIASDAPSETDTTQEQSGLMSPPPLGRTSPSRSERPVSPTKGMGGFVQSAMMKRSDSVSKRWSVQSPGLQRTDSVVSNRGGADSPSRTGRSRPASMIREPSSRPASSYGNENNSFSLDTHASPDPREQDREKTTPPSSPSKTMDPRRWSPTKASWLESALNKPESPKAKPTPPSNQPAWMAELQKAKLQKGTDPSAERTRSPTVSHRHQVSIGGLMRSSAPGTTAKPAGSSAGHKPTPSISADTRPNLSNTRKDSQDAITVNIEKANSEVASDSKNSGPSPSTSKSKPETPSQKDFRASLKPRHAPSSSTNPQEDEFKNVFGKLRKTTTQNYVAPDELKHNILRGKAGLNLTGGPKKSERKDEFKEAILAKKKEFHQVQSEGRGVTRSDSVASETPVPEGLAKRIELGRSNTTRRDSATPDNMGTDSQRSSPVSKRDSALEPLSSRSERFASIAKRDSQSGPAPRPDRPSVTTRQDSSRDVSSPRQNIVSPTTPTLQKEASAPGRLPGKLGGGALANRFNPALAGLLARGPPGMAPGGSSGSSPVSSRPAGANGTEPGPGPKLTHMTKGRARGPKRSAPTTVPAPDAAPKEPERKLESPAQPARQQESLPVAAPKPEAVSPKSFEPTAEQVPVKRPDSPNKVHDQVAAFASQRRQRSPTKVFEESNEPTSQPSSPKKLDVKRMSRFLDDSKAPEASTEPEKPKDVPSKFEAPSATKPKPSFDKLPSPDVEKVQLRSPPSSTPSRPLPDPLALPPKRQPSNDTADSNAGGRSLPAVSPDASVSPLTTSARSFPKEPEQVSRPLPTPGPKSSPPPTSSQRSPAKQSPDTPNVLSDFFGSERPQRNYHVDAAELLMQRPNLIPPKIQTLNAQLFQLAADGKKQPVPAHHERTLFEREMYLCSHTFNNEAGKKTTEVYFWAGDDVPQAVVEDASIFVSREARSMGGKVIKLQQGKETPEFLQALGGIVITQRGTGTKYDSLAPHMLCGRRYVGHVVFDEVEFTPSALCSGFPYLLTQAGKCYLWKGKGSGVDELSCARLIGMDYALTGEMEEVEDGHEPATFWNLFGGASKTGSADHWRLKPNYDKYCSRLFYSDAASKQQIIELSPFTQADLSPMGIYVIDAFFELYIVVGSRAQPQYASFHNALDFAQEYAILAAGMEDRPFVPISTVVLEGIPRDLKSVFRKWRDAQSPTTMNTNVGLKRGRSLKIVPLTQALQALSE